MGVFYGIKRKIEVSPHNFGQQWGRMGAKVRFIKGISAEKD
jgi:hypothetical protein